MDKSAAIAMITMCALRTPAISSMELVSSLPYLVEQLLTLVLHDLAVKVPEVVSIPLSTALEPILAKHTLAAQQLVANPSKRLATITTHALWTPVFQELVVAFLQLPVMTMIHAPMISAR